jgi:hypothetical protein
MRSVSIAGTIAVATFSKTAHNLFCAKKAKSANELLPFSNPGASRATANRGSGIVDTIP